MGATQTLSDRTMEQRWEVRKLWDWARSSESPGGCSVTNAEASVIYERTYAPEGFDQNVGRVCTVFEYVKRLLDGMKGMESQNWLRGITAFLRDQKDEVPV